MALAVSVLNDVHVYDLSAGKTLPEWLSEKKRKQLQKDPEFRRRVELVQDFYFPASAGRISLTPDGTHVVATGTYPPQVRVYDVAELSLKFERRLDAEVVDFCVLEDSWRKLAFLGVDKDVEFHSSSGRLHRVRVPTAGRAMTFHAPTAEVLVVGAGHRVYRINLEEGRHLAPWEAGVATSEEGGAESDVDGINAISASAGTGLVAFTGERGNGTGIVEVWDPRSRMCAGRLTLPSGQGTAIAHDASGLHLAVGTQGAEALLFDMRSSRPLFRKDHPNETPISSVCFHNESGNVLSSDDRAIKIWDRRTGAAFTTIEAPAALADVCVVGELRTSTTVREEDGGTDMVAGSLTSGDHASAWRESGLILAAGAQPKLMTWFVPELGPAPRWAGFLETLTEEMEEGLARGKEDVRAYEDYKFLTRAEVSELGLEHLLGTPLLRAFLHGFFVDIRLYTKVKQVRDATSLASESARAAKARRLREKEERRRIVRPSDGPKVNAKLASALRERGGDAAAAVEDERFKDLFSDPAFEVDESAAHVIPLRRREADSDSDNSDGDDPDERIAGRKRRASAPKQPKTRKKQG